MSSLLVSPTQGVGEGFVDGLAHIFVFHLNAAVLIFLNISHSL